MKRGPKCDFSFASFRHVCDFNGTDLIDDPQTLPVSPGGARVRLRSARYMRNQQSRREIAHQRQPKDKAPQKESKESALQRDSKENVNRKESKVTAALKMTWNIIKRPFKF